MDPVLVVGAGISGIACARSLRAGGVPVVVLDRGRRIGGRMAVRTAADRPVDTGASYFTVSDPGFESVVHGWQQRGLARPWTDTFHVYDHGELTGKTGPMRWAAARGLRSLVEDLAAGLEVRQQQVAEVGPGPTVDGRPAAAVVLAMPDPQARRLLAPALEAEAVALTDPFAPVVALTASWTERTWADVDGVFVSSDEAISWIADDGRRRGDGAPVLVAHSTSELAGEHLAAPDGATGPMVAALRRVLDIATSPATTSVHRWTFAKPAGSRAEPFFLSDARVGICGDAWSQKPRVESAFLSGAALGEAVIARLG